MGCLFAIPVHCLTDLLSRGVVTSTSLDSMGSQHRPAAPNHGRRPTSVANEFISKEASGANLDFIEDDEASLNCYTMYDEWATQIDKDYGKKRAVDLDGAMLLHQQNGNRLFGSLKTF